MVKYIWKKKKKVKQNHASLFTQGILRAFNMFTSIMSLGEQRRGGEGPESGMHWNKESILRFSLEVGFNPFFFLSKRFIFQLNNKTKWKEHKTIFIEIQMFRKCFLIIISLKKKTNQILTFVILQV